MAKRLHIALASLPLIALGGCMQTQEQIAWSNRMHTQIVAQETTAELKIGTVVAGEKLGLRERDAVKGFAMAYQQEGHGAVSISRPSNGPDDISAMRAAAAPDEDPMTLKTPEDIAPLFVEMAMPSYTRHDEWIAADDWLRAKQ